MSVAPNSGIIDFGTFTPPDAPLDGIQGQVPAPLLIEAGYVLSTNGWVPAGGGGGSVSSVTGTAPIVSSGGANPAISIPQATTLIDGYLSAIDWNTFNSKQPAGSYLTAITATTPLSGSGTSGSPLVIATANTTTTGALTSTDWNTFNGKQDLLVSGTNIKTVGSTSLLGSGDLPVVTSIVAGTNVTISPTGGTGAVTINASGGGASVSISATPPIAPSAGDLWWDNVAGKLKIYYVDANGSQWVDSTVNSSTTGGGGGGSSGFEQTFLLMGA
jgi:hypothetical protein